MHNNLTHNKQTVRDKILYREVKDTKQYIFAKVEIKLYLCSANYQIL